MVNDETLSPHLDSQNSGTEADVFGTWFARLGAIALLIGAAFGFKYAVDEGIIGPGIRVLLGIVAGLSLLAWGEWSQHRGWPRLGQAVCGGGVALLYLSIWSGFQLYGLISGVEAFAALTAVAVAGGYLAIRYESMALAVLSTIGGFGNALLIGEGFEEPSALFGYIVVLDCVVLGLAYLRGWRVLDHVALAATWMFFAWGAVNIVVLAGFSGEAPQTGLALTFATVYFLLFMSLAVARRARSQNQSPASDLILMVANSGVYFIAAMSLLSDEGAVTWATGEELRGAVILAAAGVHLIAGLILRGRDVRDPVAGAALGSAAMLASVWVPVQLDPFVVPAAWALLGSVLIQVGVRTTLTEARLPGYVLLALSLVYLTGLLPDPSFLYDPDRILLSPESGAFLAHILAFYAAAHAMGRVEQEGERRQRGLVAVLASVITLVWLSLEAVAYFRPLTAVAATQSLHFTLTGIWGLYATVTLALGISVRLAGARYMALSIFGITALKLTLHDVWMLDTLYRTLVFVGLGVVFLACSVMYHRFGDLILKDAE